MPSYKIFWTAEIDAVSPEEAARAARDLQRANDVQYFRVRDLETGASYERVTPAEPIPSAPAPARPRAKKPSESDRPAGWSEAAWARYLAVRSAKSYASLEPDKINAAVMRALDKIPPAPNPTARFFFRYGTDAADVSKRLATLGVTAEQIHYQTREESEAAERAARLSWTRSDMRSIWPSTLADAYSAKPYIKRAKLARETARELLPYLRDDVRELVREIRRVEREIRARWGSLSELRRTRAAV